MKNTNKKICSYAIGYIGQGTAYNFMSTYFIVFMTDCVGMNSTLSGTIMSIALLVEVVTGMIVGNLSDNCKSPMGKRRPFILFACVTMPVILIMLFSAPGSDGGSVTLRFTYYLIFSILFRISFSSYEIPGNALGAEIAKGYDERTTLRTITRFFGILGNTIAYIMPLVVLDIVARQATGWHIASFIAAIVCFLAWLISFILTKPYSVIGTGKKEKGNVLKGIAASYIELVKLRPMRILMVYKAAFACAIALFNTGTVYYMREVAGLSNTYISYVYFVTSLVFIVTTPVINKMAIVMGKGRQQKITMAFTGIFALAFFFIDVKSVAGIFIYIVVFAAAQNSFWQLSTSIFYDIVEVDEFANGKRREGDIMSMVSVLGTLCTAVVVELFGIVLDLAGYDGGLTVQPDSVNVMLSGAYVLAPAVCFLIAAFALMKFPLDKRRFDVLSEAVKRKRAGEDYSEYEEDLKKIFG